MSRTEAVELTVLCLVRRGNEILLQNRIKKDWSGYTLPGGHVEPGESIVAAVIREVQEESGLTVAHPHLCGVKQFQSEAGRYIVFLFTADEYTGKLVSSDEGEMRWFDRAQLAALTLAHGVPELIHLMEDDHLSEFFYTRDGDEWIIHLA